MNDEEFEEARAELESLRAEVREDLAAELGGDPDDYRADRHFQESTTDSDDAAVSDGGK